MLMYCRIYNKIIKVHMSKKDELRSTALNAYEAQKSAANTALEERRAEIKYAFTDVKSQNEAINIGKALRACSAS